MDVHERLSRATAVMLAVLMAHGTIPTFLFDPKTMKQKNTGQIIIKLPRSPIARRRVHDAIREFREAFQAAELQIP